MSGSARASRTHRGSRLCARPAVSRSAVPHNGALRVRPRAHHGREPGLSAWPSCRISRALQPGKRMPAPAEQSHAGQVPDQITNTPRN